MRMSVFFMLLAVLSSFVFSTECQSHVLSAATAKDYFGTVFSKIAETTYISIISKE